MGKRIFNILLGSAMLIGVVVWRGYLTPRATERPGAPKMPENWELTYDQDVPADALENMRKKKGVNFSSIRLIMYDVDGKKVSLFINVADSAADLEKFKAIPREVERMSLVRGLTYYELSSQDEALAEIRAGIKHLQETLP